MKKTLIILSHPSFKNSKINKTFIENTENTENLTIRHLDSIYGSDIGKFDVSLEQKILMEHERIIFQFPFYWYGIPGMLKGYLDAVFTYGFAFGSTGDKLKGKEFRIATTTGGPDFAYQVGGGNQFTISELLRPIQATASMAKMIQKPSFVFYGVAFGVSDSDVLNKIKEYQEMLKSEWK